MHATAAFHVRPHAAASAKIAVTAALLTTASATRYDREEAEEWPLLGIDWADAEEEAMLVGV